MKKNGLSLIELIIVIFILSLIMAIGMPSFWRFYSAMSLKNQVSFIVSKMKTIRYEAISKHISHGILFYEVKKEWYYIIVKDGNSNGIWIEDIKNGIDKIAEGPYSCNQEGFSKIGILNNNIPEIPPDQGYLDANKPVQFGKSGIFACSSGGSCSPGTIYFMSKSISCMQAIRVYAPTSRFSIWSYCETSGWHKKW
jgi:prepilin-type N-terminal cleavage/methylation domain-containing protein